MSLIKELKDDFIQSMKNKDVIKKNLLSLLISNAQLIAKESKVELPSDVQVLEAVKRLKKNVQENLDITGSKEAETEISILNKYLPTQLTDDDLRSKILDFISTIPLEKKGPKSIGLVMKYLVENFNGQYDGKKANSIVKESL